MATRLSRFLSAAAQRQFAWGQHDCILFAAGWVREISGVDPAANWRGHYATEREAKAILASFGGIGRVMELTLAANGWRRVSTCAPEAGDVVLAAPHDGRGQHCAGIATGNRKTALVTREGLVIAPVRVLQAWRHTGGLANG